MSTPKGLKYAKTDEWVKLEGDVATIGISDYAQEQLSDVVYVEFENEPGDTVSKGDTVATVESVKAAADVNFPADGEIIEVNEAVTENPETLNSDPYDTGWLLKMKLSDPSQLDELMDSDAYDAYNESREG